MSSLIVWVLLSQAPITPTNDGFVTDGFTRSASQRRRVIEAKLPRSTSEPFIFTDSGRTTPRLEVAISGARLEGVLSSDGTSVEWAGATPLQLQASSFRVTLAFAGRETLGFRYPAVAGPEVKNQVATFASADGSGFVVTCEGVCTWTGGLLQLQQAGRIHLDLLVTREQHAVAEIPPPAWGAVMAWDELNRRLVRFGGTDAPYERATDDFVDTTPDSRTWVFDEHVGWRSLPISGAPGERVRATMAWDRARSVMVLFGGESSGRAFHSDTYELASGGWRLAAPLSGSPDPRWAHAMAYDPVRRRTVVTCGSVTNLRFNDTWEWDGTVWSQLPDAGPGFRDAHGLAWDDNLQSLVLFGGWSPAGVYGDTWRLQGGSWTELSPALSPPPRASLAMAWDPVGRRVVMTGGWIPAINAYEFSDTWAFDGATWTQLPEAPGPWFRPAIASHPRFGVVTFGGDRGGAVLSDTLYLSDAGWLPVPLSPAEGPCFVDPAGRVGRIADRSVWTMGSSAWERTRDLPADGITHAARTPEGVFAVSPGLTWLDPLDGGAVEQLDAGAQPAAKFLFWDEVLGRLWLVTPAGEVYTLTDMGWDLRAVLAGTVRGATAAADGGLLVLGSGVDHFDPSTDDRVSFSPAPPPAPSTALYFDRHREVLVAVLQGAARPLAEWDGVEWVQLETSTQPIEFVGARDAGVLVARGGDGDSVIVYDTLRFKGSRCADDRQCVTGFCADGRCCDSACAGGNGDCLSCSMESGAVVDGTCGTIRVGFVQVCATAPPCLEAVCQVGDPVCPPLNDLSCPVDAGEPPPRRDAGSRPVDAGVDPMIAPPGCGCSGAGGLAPLLLLAASLRRRRR